MHFDMRNILYSIHAELLAGQGRRWYPTARCRNHKYQPEADEQISSRFLNGNMRRLSRNNSEIVSLQIYYYILIWVVMATIKHKSCSSNIKRGSWNCLTNVPLIKSSCINVITLYKFTVILSGLQLNNYVEKQFTLLWLTWKPQFENLQLFLISMFSSRLGFLPLTFGALWKALNFDESRLNI